MIHCTHPNKPDNLTKRGDGEFIDRAMASITGLDPLDEEEVVNDVFVQGFRGQVHMVVKAVQPSEWYSFVDPAQILTRLIIPILL
jgi:hypothetical protein